MPKNILIKVSGDVSDNSNFYNFAVDKAKENYVVVICGGGSKINKALTEAGYEIEFDGHGRNTKTWEERIIARNILEHEEKNIQDKFIGTGVIVKAPVLYAGSVLCHINGDKMVETYYKGFDEIYVFTLKDRVDKKKDIFKNYPKVEIIGI